MRIKITSDSTCDLPKHLLEQHDIAIFPLTVIKDGESFKDNVTITPAEIFAHVAAGGSLCSTAAGNLGDYQELFSQYADQYDGVLHISLGSGFSSSYQNACLAAEDFPNVRAVDSMNLSTGQGHVVLEAARLAKTCESLDEIVEKALRSAAIWDEVKDRLKKNALGMSGGQQQRLCIARALAVEPKVLLMDEPTSALDPISTSRIEDLAMELKKDYTIVIVTHNMQQAVRISDQTAFFLLGDLVEYGNTEEMFSQPKDQRTEDYITGRFG